MIRLFLLLLPMVAFADITVDPDLSLITITDCETGEPIEGVSGSTDPIYAIEKVEAIEPKPAPGESDTYCGKRSYKFTRKNTDTPPVQAPEKPQEKPPVTLDDALVYTRVPRSQVVPEDARDRLPETGRMYDTFTGQGQMVILSADGSEEVVYDCTGKPCVPFDYSVSPDGNLIAFALYRGDSLDEGRYISKTGSESQIHIYNRTTGEISAWPFVEDRHQTNPVFLPDGRIIYSSNKGGNFEPWIQGKTPDSDPVPQMYIADVDGSNSVAISPHEVSGALHPMVTRYGDYAGRIAYSQFWLSHNLPYIYTNGRNQGFATLPNMWIVNAMDMRGGDPTALLGAHKVTFRQDSYTRTQKSLHFLAQRTNGDICTANYYRGNNLGLGDVYCFTPETKGVEGPMPDHAPSNLYTVANWSVSNDNATKDETKGKIGFPEAHPDGGLILTLGNGLCSTVQLNKRHAAEPERAGCDVGLYQTDVIPSNSKDDMELIVDSDQWHEFGAKVLSPWSVEAWPEQNTDDGSCQVASSDAFGTDAYPKKDYNFNNWMYEAANNGTRLPLIDQREMAAVRFYEVVQNKGRKDSAQAALGAVGHELRLLGDAPLLEDGSFKAELPCDVPYVMAGVDAGGHVIMRDQMPQSLRPGEERTCKGCHRHADDDGREYEDSLAYGADPIQLLSSVLTPTWADVKPIIEAKFAQCGVPTDYDSLVWDSKQQALPIEKRVEFYPGKSGTKPYWLERPQLSLFIDSMYARKSLLYWMAVGERVDGLTDDSYSDDIDYAGWCDAGATEQEAATIRDWIDAGARE